MSVWPHAPAALSGSSGALISISIDVQSRDLESLLESLARLSFPVNPQIYHDAAMVYVYPDGRREIESATLVEFSAYASFLDEVRQALAKSGFDPGWVQVVDMLSEIHAAPRLEPAPQGSPYAGRFRCKIRAAAAAG